MLATLFAAVVAALLPSPQGSQADAPAGLTVVIVDVGQGDGIVIKAPNGTVHVVDAGPTGAGTAAMLPAIAALQPSAYGNTFLSHFHEDHAGGLDEVLSALPFTAAIDRGDVNRPTTVNVTQYVAAAGSRRQFAPLGAVYPLGGGAQIRVIALNGNILGGGFVDPTASAQEENSRSLTLRLEYGSFSMWLGGDLTGGGNSTADVETPASLACGDVDVYKLNHHGSNTSTSLNLVANLQPELAVVSCGVGNSFGHPTSTIVNRLNQAAAARALLSTSTGSASTIGFGVTGAIRIDSDGRRYRASASNGDFLDFYCDEVATPALQPGDVRISEIQRNPAIVPDTNGEYVEVVNVGAKPVGLRGMRLVDNTASVTLASNFLLVPGRPMVFQVDGAPSRNGGQPLGMALPFGTTALGDTSDTVTIDRGGVVVDTLTYNTGFPGGSGVAAERRDLLAANTTANWLGASAVYGAGDRGSPAGANPGDATNHPVRCGVSIDNGKFTVHGTAFEYPGLFSVFGLAYGTTPAVPFGGALIPLAFDPLLQVSIGAPGFFAFVPAIGYRSVDVAIPQPNPVAGVTLYAAHIVLDFNLAVPGVSTAVPFVLP